MAFPAMTLPHHVQLKKIAILTDFTSDAERPLRFAASLAQWYGADLVVAHACAPDSSMKVPSGPVQMEQRAKSLIGRAGLAQSTVSTAVTASTVSELLGALNLHQPDLLVLATHARTGISKLLAGSVAEEVFRQAQSPVLVLPPEFTNIETGGAQFQRVLFATDLSPGSARVFPYAMGISQDHGARVIALYVDVDGPGFSFEHLIALQRLEDWLRRQAVTCGDLRQPELVVRCGHPAEEIHQVASEYKPDLIVIGARPLYSMPGLASHFVGGTAYEVACTSACPVLIVPDVI